MRKSVFSILGVLSAASLAYGASSNDYVQTNLVSDLPGVAQTQDPNLVNPWGIAAGPGGPFWVNDNGTGLSTIYNGTGKILPLVVTVPAPVGSPGPSAPTGLVFNGSSSFKGSVFIFATEEGTISGWTPGTTTGQLQVTAPAGSVYKGLASGNNGSGDLLYAANFGLGRVDVFNSNFQSTSLSGKFQDSSLPAGYAPFNIDNVNGKLYVTYALQDAAKKDDVSGPGNGFIDVYDLNGNLLQRLASNGKLNSPWGLALAPANFGALSGDLLVGNFGDGTINAYDPNSGAPLGTLKSQNGTPLTISGLWGLSFGNGAQQQGLDTLYFTAGIAGPGQVEDHGLFGSISAAPEPASWALGAFGLAALCFVARRRQPSLPSEK